MWLNVIELYSLLAEKNNQSNLRNLNDELAPIIESYFVIY